MTDQTLITIIFPSFTSVAYFLNMFDSVFKGWSITMTRQSDGIQLILYFSDALTKDIIDTIWKQAAASGVTKVIIDNDPTI